MKKFLVVLVCGADVYIRLCAASAKEEIGSDNDIALNVAFQGDSEGFDCFVDLIAHIKSHDIELVGEFCGYFY